MQNDQAGEDNKALVWVHVSFKNEVEEEGPAHPRDIFWATSNWRIRVRQIARVNLEIDANVRISTKQCQKIGKIARQ